MIPPKLVLAAVVLGFSVVAYATTTYDDSSEAWNTLLDLETAGTVLEVYIENHPSFVRPDDWMPLNEFAKSLPSLYSTRLPRRDGWGRGLIIGIIYDELTIISTGENGVADTIGSVKDDPDAPDYFGDDLVLVVGGDGLANGPRTVVARQRVTVADMRSIATAVEAFAVDNNLYPLQDDGLRTLESIRHELEPIYIRTIPLNDAWGNPMLYWCDESRYIILSLAADGSLDSSWNQQAPLDDITFIGETHDPDVEIVFVDGQFTQWPALDR